MQNPYMNHYSIFPLHAKYIALFYFQACYYVVVLLNMFEKIETQ